MREGLGFPCSQDAFSPPVSSGGLSWAKAESFPFDVEKLRIIKSLDRAARSWENHTVNIGNIENDLFLYVAIEMNCLRTG